MNFDLGDDEEHREKEVTESSKEGSLLDMKISDDDVGVACTPEVVELEVVYLCNNGKDKETVYNADFPPLCASTRIGVNTVNTKCVSDVGEINVSLHVPTNLNCGITDLSKNDVDCAKNSMRNSNKSNVMNSLDIRPKSLERSFVDTIKPKEKYIVSNACFARVLVEIQANQEFKEKVKICYQYKGHVFVESKFVKVEYSWKPPKCSHCKVFGHGDSNCDILRKLFY
ncbi:reverse transcriptase domain-containing protein [Artemisia annua]|uniref:Reverse transcriptase domain-containing protein n=1 Tax=Artemisia annua TaxID=35608 RepID=A0A2U1QFN7_ARTAN|nr:reverse transcriptase domain-containing protein [Artemisia annua]